MRTKGTSSKQTFAFDFEDSAAGVEANSIPRLTLEWHENAIRVLLQFAH